MARHNNYTGKLFELSIISAHDLAAVSKSMRTYAVAWINPERKLTTRVDENGHENPKWNEKFIFRVDDDVLVSDNAMVMIEIYALTWLRVVLIGTVCFHISTLIPPSSRPKSNKASAAAGGGGAGSAAASTTRFATLQIRRPSGRPQGTLNIGVAIVSSTMRSMPLQSELTASTITDGGDTPASNVPLEKYRNNNAGKPNLRRSQSEMFSDKSSYCNPAGSVINESTLFASQLGFKPKGGRGGGSQLGSLVSSDVGPSASVVAAAIAKGLYPRPNDDGGSSILDNWTEEDSVEGLKSKIARWRKETPPVHNRKGKAGSSVGKELPPVPPRRRHSDGGGLFSCFGNAYGCEFSISCGGAGKKNARYLGG